MTRERRLQIVAQRAVGLALEYCLFGPAEPHEGYERAMKSLAEACREADLSPEDLGEGWPAAEARRHAAGRGT